MHNEYEPIVPPEKIYPRLDCEGCKRILEREARDKKKYPGLWETHVRVIHYHETLVKRVQKVDDEEVIVSSILVFEEYTYSRKAYSNDV